MKIEVELRYVLNREYLSHLCGTYQHSSRFLRLSGDRCLPDIPKKFFKCHFCIGVVKKNVCRNGYQINSARYWPVDEGACPVIPVT